MECILCGNTVAEGEGVQGDFIQICKACDQELTGEEG